MIIKADFKHWLTRLPPGARLKPDIYPVFAQQTREALGERGIVAVANARGPNHKLGADFRYEQFLAIAESSGNRILQPRDGSVFYDPQYEFYGMKAQEVITQYKEVPLVLFAYNLPAGFNLSEKQLDNVLSEAYERRCILGITGTSCIEGLEMLVRDIREGKIGENFWGNFDFFVTHSSAEEVPGRREKNRRAQRFYNEYIGGRTFTNPQTQEQHQIGAIAVSGGHRTPTGIRRLLLYPPSVGTSYVEIPEPSTPEEFPSPAVETDIFFDILRRELRSPFLRMKRGKGSIREAGIHALKMGWDKIFHR